MNRVEKIDNLVPIRTALISVSDKSNLETLVHGLITASPGIRILSTGGTYKAIQQLTADYTPDAVELVSIADYTGQPEMQGGLVKTLDFKIYLGLLAETYNSSHIDDLERTRSWPIDLTVVNLYPFQATIATKGSTLEDARANIDIGGPTMIRASAKNYVRVATLCSPDRYAGFIEHIQSNRGAADLACRFNLAREAFSHITHYDKAISQYLDSAAIPHDLYVLADKE